jgi:hypothetical protein
LRAPEFSLQPVIRACALRATSSRRERTLAAQRGCDALSAAALAGSTGNVTPLSSS